MQQEQRFQTRRTFVEGVGHVVEQVLMATPLKPGQSVVPVPPNEPPRQVIIAAKDVPLELARQVVEAAGLVAVPPNFLNPEQLAELGIELAETGDLPNGNQVATPPAAAKEKLSPEEMIARIKQAGTFDELNALVAEEGRRKVLAAAEERATELKEQGVA